jgi:hypothetical protein
MSSTSNAGAMSTTGGNKGIAWALLAIAAAANVAGYVFGWYDQFWWWDEAIHAYTTFAVTLVLALYTYGTVLTGARQHPFLLVLIIATIALGLGGLWELAEWGYDTLLTQQNTIKSVPDRLVDLIMDTLGGFVAGWVLLRMVNK